MFIKVISFITQLNFHYIVRLSITIMNPHLIDTSSSYHWIYITLMNFHWVWLIFITFMNFHHIKSFSSNWVISFYPFEYFSSQWWIVISMTIIITIMTFHRVNEFSSNSSICIYFHHSAEMKFHHSNEFLITLWTFISSMNFHQIDYFSSLLPSSALAPASAWAELVLVWDNPGRPTTTTTTIRNSTF